MAYYRNAGMLAEQFRRIRALPALLRDQICVIVVDDGSPDGEARGEPIGCPLSLYRIDVDVRWNQDAARNIAAHNAATQWLLLTDMDHIVSEPAWNRVLLDKLHKANVYRFSRTTLEADGKETPYKPHPNSWLMTRTMYDLVGGYDEALAGHYGTDADFRDRVAQAAAIEMLEEHLIRVPRETIPDASTTTYVRKGAPEDVGAIPRIKAARALVSNWKPLRLSFAHKKIYEHA
jgi:glycosyltransferase involved in cell wall biosynthesis